MWCVRDCDGHIDPDCGFTDIQGLAVYRWHSLRRAQPLRRWRVVECPEPLVVVPRVAASPSPAVPVGGDAQLARRDAYLKYRAVFDMWYR